MDYPFSSPHFKSTTLVRRDREREREEEAEQSTCGLAIAVFIYLFIDSWAFPARLSKLRDARMECCRSFGKRTDFFFIGAQPFEV